MAEFRQDTLTGQWVVISPERARRPIPRQKQPRVAARKFVPLVLRRLAIPGTKNFLEIHDNAFPAVSPWPKRVSLKPHKHDQHIAVGEQLLIRFSHDRELMQATTAERQVFAAAIVAEYTRIEKNRSVRMIALFRNHGVAAGATVIQPHHQLWSLPIPSNSHEQELIWLRGQKTCPSCSLIKKIGPWLVASNNSGKLFCPPASHFAGTITIVPKRHVRTFTQLTQREQLALIELAATGVKKLRKRFGDVAFNEVWHEYLDKTQRTHFRIEILPRLMQPASLEFAHHLFINPLVPEKLAKELR